MIEVELLQAIESGQNVTSGHFGGNVIAGKNTDDGIPTEQNSLAHQELDIEVARYPAGEPDLMYKDGMVINGALPDHLINFLMAARASGQSVVLVTPTHEGYHGADILTEFTSLVLGQFSDVIHAFEIGNEYWNHQTETSYGEVANDSVLAISSQLTGQYGDIPIWVQMGDAGGQASEFAKDAPLSEGIGWLWRNIGANNLILDQLTPEARATIDGVVEHYYFREDHQYLGFYNDQNIVMDHEVWQSAFGRNLTLNITEWNIRTTNLDQLGIRAASTLIAQFSFMMDMEVDEAYVWPPMHNTSTDLAGSSNVLLDPETGIVINSVGGATFDLMSSSLVGLQYRPSATTSDSSLLHNYVYSGEDKVVVYVTSRSDETESVSFNLGNFFPGASLISATQIGYDKTSSDGRHYDYVQREFVDSEAVAIDGELYYTNEHDVRATITEHDTSQSTNGGNFTFTLLPYEVIELTYEIPNFERTDGTNGKDIISSEDSKNDLVFSLAGNDNIQAGSGDDSIYAGDGDDYIDAGLGDDLVSGGAGNDIIRGRGNNDIISGGSGNDDIDGGWGDDKLDGGSGSDILNGGWGRDTITLDSSLDIAIGGGDDDLFQLDGLQKYGAGWGGINASNQYQDGTMVFLPVANYNLYSSVIIGGAGYDTIELSASDDAIFLHNGFSSLPSSLNVSEYVSDLPSGLMISGIEEFRAGAGNDFVDLTSDVFHLQGQSIVIHGDYGHDVVWGSAANETIFGGEGNDTLFGGAGNDEISGGTGADVFEFTSTSIDTSLTDFDVREGDELRFYNTENVEFDAGSVALTPGGINISYRNTVSETEHYIFISLVTHSTEFAATLPEILNALEIV
ncbi:calcium-binding protein [Sulfitobacter donghicola]|uniref:Calcium-binding protein n=1 Tax=Sulfitobacter donghicola DSW-25 = KCTC 12864 = JCM 14565 TaxID=1300350 RepID=A0A073IGJ1_9RHOB|nr:calcium-binding protein [Sulfitobacter donghicola]KEJ88596.1 hypothetical protein DSW25_15965 [Sulfitobacter donghicola DSW-25 = KCTC 12864 = JCM 14565]KIN69534.1 Hemolysin-type calcium-binding protein [Sulfitobacter donghicola DSW-25 = KCTC 12864 = JCM 14565]